MRSNFLSTTPTVLTNIILHRSSFNMIPFKITGVLTKIGFSISFLANLFLIYNTVFHVRKIHGTYKQMIIYFSLFGILFSGLELIARPFAHNFNSSLLFFSVSTFEVSQELRQLSISIWAGCYLFIVSFIAVQFFYRFLCLFDAKKTKMFDGFKTLAWVIYPLIPGAIYSVAFYLFCLPDEYSDEYVSEDVLKNYGLIIAEVPRFVVVPYDVNGILRIENLFLLISGVSMIGFHYTVMLYCGLKMHFNMKKELKKFSAPQRKLQRQFFYALVVQSLGPTVFLVLPAVPILMSPLLPPSLGIKISWQTGWLYTLVGLYPPFDSIGFMVIVSEYKKVIKNQIRFLMSDGSSQSTVMSPMNNSRASRKI